MLTLINSDEEEEEGGKPDEAKNELDEEARKKALEKEILEDTVEHMEFFT